MHFPNLSPSTLGLFATGGAVFRKGERAEEDCDAVRLFRESGAIPLVVTNTSEMCLWWETYNKLHGKTNNPYDTTRTPGGSSGEWNVLWNYIWNYVWNVRWNDIWNM